MTLPTPSLTFSAIQDRHVSAGQSRSAWKASAVHCDGSDVRVDPRKTAFQHHWEKELDRWFPQGIDTPGIVLIKAHATRVTYWDGEEQEDVKV